MAWLSGQKQLGTLRQKKVYILICIAFLMAGCTSEFKPLEGSFSRSFGSTGGMDRVPSTDRLDPSCQDSQSYDVCLFQKSCSSEQSCARSKK